MRWRGQTELTDSSRPRRNYFGLAAASSVTSAMSGLAALIWSTSPSRLALPSARCAGWSARSAMISGKWEAVGISSGVPMRMEPSSRYRLRGPASRG